MDLTSKVRWNNSPKTTKFPQTEVRVRGYVPLACCHQSRPLSPPQEECASLPLLSRAYFTPDLVFILSALGLTGEKPLSLGYRPLKEGIHPSGLHVPQPVPFCLPGAKAWETSVRLSTLTLASCTGHL